jgi:hypothetical protein
MYVVHLSWPALYAVGASISWCLQVKLHAHCAGAGEPAPRGGLAQTVMSLAPGAARRPPVGLGIGADDLPTIC